MLFKKKYCILKGSFHSELDSAHQAGEIEEKNEDTRWSCVYRLHSLGRHNLWTKSNS